MTSQATVGSREAPRLAVWVIVAGVIANMAVTRMIPGHPQSLFYNANDLMGDFIKHVMSFPGRPLAPSVAPNLIAHFHEDIAINLGVLGHFHNMPLTVFLSLLVRPAFSIVDPVVLYGVMASAFLAAWAYFNHRFAHPDAGPQAIGIALFCYPFAMLMERGNLFAGITAVCLLVVLCRRKQDLTAAVLLAVAANIRPNVAMLVIPLLAFDRASLAFLLKTGALGAILALVCFAADNALYPAYNLQSVIQGLALYNAGYVIGPFAMKFGSSLWGAARHFLPVTGLFVTLCTLMGLVPLALAWLGRNRLSYAARCFLAIAGCTLSTSVLGDYHLLIFTAPLLLVRRDDPAYWPIVLGACWMLIPKHYNPLDDLSWQTYLNPAGLIVAVVCIVAAYRGLAARAAPADAFPPAAAQS